MNTNYSIIAKQKNLTADGLDTMPIMNEKGKWWKMKAEIIINDKPLAWFILKGIIDDFIEYTFENTGDWSIQISRTASEPEKAFFKVSSVDGEYNHYWAEELSNWL